MRVISLLFVVLVFAVANGQGNGSSFAKSTPAPRVSESPRRSTGKTIYPRRKSKKSKSSNREELELVSLPTRGNMNATLPKMKGSKAASAERRNSETGFLKAA